MIVISFAAGLAFIVTLLLMLAAAGRLSFPASSGFDVSAALSDRDIFRRQLAELEKMRAHGLLDDSSAGEARLELVRRILAAEREAPAGGDKADGNKQARQCDQTRRGRGFRLFLSLAIIFVPLFSALVYYFQGQPFAPAHPFADFMARDPAGLSLPEHIVRLEALSARAPQNAQYADRLASLYLQAGRFQDAANTYSHAMAIGGDTADRLLGYALALTGFEDGVVGQDAEAAFRNVLRLDPQNPQAQLFLARGLVQGGKKAEAIALLQDFWQKTPADSPWRQNLQAAIVALKSAQSAPDSVAAGAAGGIAARGKPAADPTAEQRAFIAASLGRLEARLKAAPGDLQAWTMLINAYLLLGQRDKAQAAALRGLSVLPPAAAQSLAAFARQKGLSVAAK
ncbi:c-type cytochrome biogenesis protein CcmI [Candidatus Tokpelaia sp.]|uniref:c-type cytochrome biogenesis protein CcmI n=1 Tax=Candidatus Tokpelaia sp. TaxID=2233777 RepID=UPI0012389549|nr:c-type cytochrome biogenesis protein CcmI [Candidatus Tokpelaia sp.]KAA6405920.1 c-type cytochrome biogenesis protein CcmI [Candidatus Tokpelaia sp.]